MWALLLLFLSLGTHLFMTIFWCSVTLKFISFIITCTSVWATRTLFFMGFMVYTTNLIFKFFIFYYLIFSCLIAHYRLYPLSIIQISFDAFYKTSFKYLFPRFLILSFYFLFLYNLLLWILSFQPNYFSC